MRGVSRQSALRVLALGRPSPPLGSLAKGKPEDPFGRLSGYSRETLAKCPASSNRRVLPVALNSALPYRRVVGRRLARKEGREWRQRTMSQR